METRIIEITDPMGATRVEIGIPKSGKEKRRERRAKERKINNH